MRKLRNKVAVVLAVPLALAMLVACGGAETQAADEPDDTSTSAAAEPDEGDGDEIDAAAFFGSMASAMESATTAHVTLSSAGGGQDLAAEGDIDFSSDPPAMQMTMSVAQLGDGIEMRLVDGAMYMQIPGMSDGKFIKTSLDDPTNPMGSMTDQMDPRAQFSTMQDAVKSVTFVGDEEIDGESLKHYKVVLDGTKMVNQQGVTMPDEVTYDMWVDDSDRLRQMSFETAGVTITTTISDWGKNVRIRAPRPAQIMEMPSAP